MTGVFRSKVLGLILIGIIVPSLLSFGCIQNEKTKVPVIEVNFTHYVIEGKHVVKINSLRKINVDIEKVRITRSPPFPGIHAYAIYPKDGKTLISPTAYTSIDREGDNLTLYIGIEKNEIPQNGTRVIVILEVWGENSKKLAFDRGVLNWR